MNVIFVRHGNTFSKNDTVFWVGRDEDLPLVPYGEEQAKRVGLALEPLSSRVSTIYTAGLQRSFKTASIIASSLGKTASDCIVDPRLDEISYGVWGGKTTEEIIQSGYGSHIDQWNSNGIYPKDCGWSPSYDELLKQTGDFLSQLGDSSGLSVVVTSNGTMRFFSKHLNENCQSKIKESSLKIRTGHLACFAQSEKEWSVKCWNVAPEDFLFDKCFS